MGWESHHSRSTYPRHFGQHSANLSPATPMCLLHSPDSDLFLSAQGTGFNRPYALNNYVQACRDRIRELVSLNDHFDALTPEKLTSVQKEVNDCAYAESAGLSKDDIIAAYKLRDGTGREVIKRIRNAAEKTIADDNTLRDAARKIAQGFLDEDK